MTPNDPYLLTPGPLTTSLSVKQAMLHDWGSWDNDFNELTAEVCARLLRVAGGQDSHVCVPMQGSGTFAVEATLGTLVPRNSTTLVLMNGAYGQRISKILDRLAVDAWPSTKEITIRRGVTRWHGHFDSTRRLIRWWSSTAKPVRAFSTRFLKSPRSVKRLASA